MHADYRKAVLECVNDILNCIKSHKPAVWREELDLRVLSSLLHDKPEAVARATADNAALGCALTAVRQVNALKGQANGLMRAFEAAQIPQALYVALTVDAKADSEEAAAQRPHDACDGAIYVLRELVSAGRRDEDRMYQPPLAERDTVVRFAIAALERFSRVRRLAAANGRLGAAAKVAALAATMVFRLHKNGGSIEEARADQLQAAAGREFRNITLRDIMHL